MREIVYIDIIFFENLLMNYLLLYAINRFCRYKAKWWRVICGALVGACYVIVIFLPNTKLLYSSIMKFAISVLMVYIAFSPNSMKRLVKTIILFYIEAFVFSGGILGIAYFFNYNFQTINGAFMIKGIEPWHLILGSLIANISIKLGFDFYENFYFLEQNKICIEVVLHSRICKLNALIDTGNSLKDPITNTPIIVAYIKAIINILPLELREPIMEGQWNYDELIKKVSESSLSNRIRMIPYKALGVENGTLIGIRVDMVKAKSKLKEIILKDAIIAIYNSSISDSGDYDAIVFPEILK